MVTTSPATHAAKALPTKGLFIDTLIRDVDLLSAVVDLVDNSVDGARRLRGGGNYTGLYIDIAVAQDKFTISDNCGGIPLDVAMNYAFCFGVPGGRSGAGSHLIGQFGVGMKRTLFKVAEIFSVASATSASRFSLVVDVQEWKQATGAWEFPFDTYDDGLSVPDAEVGTVVDVQKMKTDISSEFSNADTVNTLREKILLAHEFSIREGLQIKFNGDVLKARERLLLQSAEIIPGIREDTIKDAIKLKTIVGVGDPDTSTSGWYIYCNGRLILDAEQTTATGWGYPAGLPKHHQQFNRFYGFAFLDADDASVLPWNTAKTGMSEDSESFKILREKLIIAARPVIKFLNRLREEEKGIEEADNAPLLTKLMEDCKPVPVSTLVAGVATEQGAFLWPEARAKTPPRPPVKNIQFRVLASQADAAVSAAGASSASDLGKTLFERFCEQEGITE